MPRTTSPVDNAPDPKRRKIRKGTRSCWACKRRKVRCDFDDEPFTSDAHHDDATPAVCKGCRQRGTACVGQDFPEDSDPGSGFLPSQAAVGGVRQVGDRLGRMEALVERLVQTQTSGQSAREILHQSGLLGRPRSEGPGRCVNETGEGMLTPECSESDGPAYMNWYGRVVENGLERETLTDADTTPAATGSTPASGQHTRAGAGKYAYISKALMRVWPSEGDIDIICSVKVQIPSLLQRAFLKPFHKQSSTDMGPAAHARCPPPLDTHHPVIIARKLLHLAVMLQHLHPSLHKELEQLSVPHRELMRRMAEQSITLVTTNEELIGSLEGLECLALEGMYQGNCGNLRRSWLAFRRAVTLAQLMRIHKGIDSPSLRILELQTRQRIDPQHLWFRILYADRHLSLMLGLPAGTHVNHFASLPDPVDAAASNTDNSRPGDATLAAQDRLGYVHAMIAGRILERNEKDLGDEAFAMTQEIDLELQRATRTMPAQWWLTPSLVDVVATAQGSSARLLFCETARLVDQLYHYFLLTQLHLPYMLRLSTEARRYDYSKVACINASREILARYVAYRQVSVMAFTCRGADFFTFFASMTLLLGHLDSHQRGYSGGAASNHDSYLVHQRLADRGLVEKVLSYLEDLAALNSDMLSRQSADILRQMLVIEDDAADGGGVYSTSPAVKGEDCGTVSNDGAITWAVPYFGLIRIAKEGVSRPRAEVDEVRGATGQQAAKQPSGLAVGNTLLGGWQLGATAASTEMVAPNGAEEVVPEDLGPYETSGAQQTLMPGLTAEAEDWAFQGVDMAFFDRLMGGAVDPVTGAPGTEMGHGWSY
ncbi:uncharacterized protein E0L32_008920 [Thyridium curvatum]|uniref:Zn(2)-C6 fungal-type domain-containing protein n=1 Tax=Thyridium curvatum TaxID=1093900 RepID=A0A507AYL3_9PEZI|nr:uncharacterized protein E0L32_008920 [Thyridium curvatum]TPX09898.1 hypothetical protein E0L32_008920 [Thyridium curvatum]